MLRNLKASATSAKPSTTFTLFSQLPERGRLLSHCGNSAKSPKGSASASPKPPMPAVSCQAPPSAVSAPANKEPRMGPVQLKDTSARVSAMKKMPISPPAWLAFWSIRFTQLAGSVISK